MFLKRLQNDGCFDQAGVFVNICFALSGQGYIYVA